MAKSKSPWKAPDDRQQGYFWVLDAKGNELARVHTSLEDARLMAAAPTLLTCLRELKDAPDDPEVSARAGVLLALVEKSTDSN